MRYSDLKNALTQIGLDPLSIKIYLILISAKKQTGISDLANDLGVYRQKIYNALEELYKYNLVLRTAKFSRNIEAKSPRIVYSLLKKKQYEINKTTVTLKESLPDLITSFSSLGREPSVRIFDGTNKFIFLLATILDEISIDDQILSYNENNDFYKVVNYDYFFDIWIEKRVSKKIPIKILLNSD
ncbi:MAG: helix-turn-helix domain-containing protein, partial [Patescibacteria group bacterium]